MKHKRNEGYVIVSRKKLKDVCQYEEKKYSAGRKLQDFCQYEDKENPKNKVKHIYFRYYESESTTRFKNRSSDRTMTSDWLVYVSNDRCTTTNKAIFSLSQRWPLNTGWTVCWYHFSFIPVLVFVHKILLFCYRSCQALILECGDFGKIFLVICNV